MFSFHLGQGKEGQRECVGRTVSSSSSPPIYPCSSPLPHFLSYFLLLIFLFLLVCFTFLSALSFPLVSPIAPLLHHLLFFLHFHLNMLVLHSTISHSLFFIVIITCFLTPSTFSVHFPISFTFPSFVSPPPHHSHPTLKSKVCKVYSIDLTSLSSLSLLLPPPSPRSRHHLPCTSSMLPKPHLPPIPILLNLF